MSEPKLLPCPFCGAEAATGAPKKTRRPFRDTLFTNNHVRCSHVGCGLYFTYFSRNEWNIRIPWLPEDLVERVEHLLHMIEVAPNPIAHQPHYEQTLRDILNAVKGAK